MKILTLTLFLTLSTSLALATEIQNRCGWVHNPTPANWNLIDRDGVWVIGVQGGRQAAGELPEFPADRDHWVKTNGNYGYGCACLKVKVDRKAKAVLAIQSARVLALAKCRADKSLPQGPNLFCAE